MLKVPQTKTPINTFLKGLEKLSHKSRPTLKKILQGTKIATQSYGTLSPSQVKTFFKKIQGSGLKIREEKLARFLKEETERLEAIHQDKIKKASLASRRVEWAREGEKKWHKDLVGKPDAKKEKESGSLRPVEIKGKTAPRRASPFTGSILQRSSAPASAPSAPKPPPLAGPQESTRPEISSPEARDLSID